MFKATCAGTATVPKFESIVQRDGSIKLVKAGVRYLDEEIQADKDAGDINVIVRRYAAGDTNALNAVQGYYADLTQLPESRQQMLQIVMDAESRFDELPSELREAFGNDWRRAFVSMETSEFEDIVKQYNLSLNEKEVENKE